MAKNTVSKKFSVLLLYPDYMSDGPETYLAHVMANDPAHAVETAQLEASGENEVDEPTDFASLLVVDGHVEDLNGEL